MSIIKKDISKSKKPQDQYEEYCDVARQIERNGTWTEAAKAYFKAGEYAESKLEDFKEASVCYEKSADCYRNGLSPQAYEIYRGWIEICLKRGIWKCAIKLSFEIGYIYEKQFCDVEISKEFYDWGDDLRREHNQKHVCLFTQDYIVKYWQKISHGYIHEVDIIEALKSEKMIDALFKTVCRKCVPLWEIHYKYYIEIRDANSFKDIQNPYLKLRHHVKCGSPA
ncbi:hypothetical protein RF11_15090 [Thelohanellus kitauei]|uniref:Alpha-soluble NSF attachment protein n=1 Tax=Thelohanellus kitauei TaxID=669202 RepID=A0A0C2M7B5_THEKT|nr:hypothetical protein RF11_15090 [Thelohanellus kitauei]